jgi:hypothetical protein
VAAGEKQQVPLKPGLGKDTLWLVKSGDRVLGPFNTGEIIRRLRAKELVVIDEIISPQSRWRHVRDEQIFASVVDEIRTGLMTVRDDTEVGEGTGTPTITARGVNEDGTPVPISHGTSVGAATNARFDSSFNVSRISDAEIVSETEDVEHIHVASAREIEKPSPRGRAGRENGRESGDSSAPKKNSGVHSTLSYAPPGKDKKKDAIAFVSKTSRALWMLVIAAIVIIGASVYIFKIIPVKRAGQRSEEIARLRKEADRAWSRAEFLRAQKLYEQINREAHTDLETDLRQAILQLRVEGDTLSAKRRLQELVPRLMAPEAKTRARIALAVANLQSDEPLEAQNSLMALVREPEAGPIAYFNLGCAQAANGLRAEAIETLKKLDSHPSLSAPSRLLRALLSLKDGAPKVAANATDLDSSGTQPAFHQELYTIGTVADWLEGNKKRSNQRLRMALDTDPMQTEEFFFDPLLYLEAVRWKQLLPYVHEYSNKAKSNGAKALYALALIKSDRRSEAQKFLAESLSPRMNDADLQTVSAYSLLTQGRDDEARGALKFTKSNQQEDAPMASAILDARLFERAGDRSSADAVWSDLAKRPHPPLAALVTAARLESQIATEKGIGAVERLKVLYPNSVLVEKLYDDVFDVANSTAGATGASPSEKGKAP